MTTLADATQESINAAIEERLGSKGSNGNGGGGGSKCESTEIKALKDMISTLQRQVSNLKNDGGNNKNDGGNNTNSGGVDKSNWPVYDPCPKCGKRHKPREGGQCWFTVDKDKAPGWFRRRNPHLFPKDKGNSE